MSPVYNKDLIREHFEEWLENTISNQGDGWIDENLDDLHHHAFNTDYFIIGTQRAIDWMGEKAFNIIQVVKEYEQDNFGQCNTDLGDPEKVVNMYAYIIGEEIVQEYRTQREAEQAELDVA